MLRKAHPIAGIIALLTIVSFWCSTLFVELFASLDSVVLVKNVILWGLLLLIPALALTGASGFSLAQGRSGALITNKRKRMPFIALNGLFILVPAAFYLTNKANLGEFDNAFYFVQLIELMAGATNVILLVRSAREGRRLVNNQ